MHEKLKGLIRHLVRKGWKITSTTRNDEATHILGIAVDALPPSLRSGVPLLGLPLYKRPSIIVQVEEVNGEFDVQALIEEGHVHFMVKNSLFDSTSPTKIFIGGSK